MTREEIIKKHQDFSGITDWFKNGLTGKGVVVWNAEGAGGSHAIATRQRILDAAPDCTVVEGSLNKVYSNGKLTVTVKEYATGFAGTVDEYIDLRQIDIVTYSVKGISKDSRNYEASEKYWAEVQEKHPNVVFFTSSANDGEEETCGGFPANVAYLVGACGLRNGKPVRDGYSNYGEDLDFMNLTGIQGGTSFSSPYTAGMAALIKQFTPIEHHEEIFQFLKMICMDMEEEGFDIRTGWGIPILPKISELTYIRMQIDNRYYYVNGNNHIMDTAPFIKDDRTFVPIRFVAAALGADVEWDNDERQVTIKYEDTIIVMTIDERLIFINGRKDYMDTAPFIKDDRTFVPIRWVAEYLGCKVEWLPVERKIMIFRAEV